MPLTDFMAASVKQIAILSPGHARTRLLVYQCGINGIYEALYHGVPIICLPVFFDQFDNAQRVASRGIGLRLDITTLTSEQLMNAVNTVLGDQK